MSYCINRTVSISSDPFAPENVGNVTFYFVVGEGEADKTLYLDNIQLRRGQSAEKN
jgi:hypothetical protein